MATQAPAAVAAAILRDDLDIYNELPKETDLDLDVLAWWKARDHDLGPKASEGRPRGLPNLAKMGRQFLGRPASSAGVERLFSKAGTLYGDDKKRQEDTSLEHALFACANTED